MEPRSEFKGLGRSERRQRVIDTAARVFHEKGYHAATLDDVAQALGLTKAAIYHYVPSKDDLLSIIYIQALESFFARAGEIGELDVPPTEKLRLLVRHHVEHVILENLPMFSVFFSEQNQLPAREFEEIRAAKVRYTRVVAGILEEGMEQGVFRRADPWLRACAILGMCNWLYKWYRPGPDAPAPDEVSAHFVDLIEAGCRAPAGPEGEAARRRRDLLRRARRKARDLSSLLAEAEALE